MKHRKPLALTVSAILLCAALSACGGGGAESATGDLTSSDSEENRLIEELIQGTEQAEVDTTRSTTAGTGGVYDQITVALNADYTNWDPNLQNEPGNVMMKGYVYQNLFIVIENTYIPVVAKGYTEVDDLHWDVEIWDNVYDSQGNHLTASDVVYSYETRIAAGTAAKYDAFESIEMIDDYTVRFSWTEAVDSINSLGLIWGETYLYTQAAYESHNFATDPVGTGPYRVTELVSGAKTVLERRDDYWKTDDLTYIEEANVQTIVYEVVTEGTQNYIGLQTGIIDYSYNVPDENIKDFQSGGEFADDYNVYQKLGTSSYFLTCNQSENGVGADENFRLAVYYALDNQAIAESAGNYVAAESFSNPAASDHQDVWAERDTYINTFDPDLAREYLAQSSYNGEKLTLLGESNEYVKNMLTMIQALLLNVGIDCEIEAVDYQMVVSKSIETDGWDIAMFYYGSSINISGMNRMLNREEWGTGASFGFVYDDELNDLFMTARTLEGHTDENMTALVEHIVDNALYYMVCFPVNNIIYTKDIAELYTDYSGAPFINASNYYLD